MKYLFRILGRIFKGLGVFSKYIPVGLGGLFLFTDFIIHWFKYDFLIAISSLAKSVFTAELVINEKVLESIYSPNTYGFIDFVHILVSIFVLYSLVKWISKALISITGSQAQGMTYVWGAITVMLISVVGISIQDGHLGFIPVKDSIIFLIMNLQPVISSIFVWKAPEIVETAINMTNSTIK